MAGVILLRASGNQTCKIEQLTDVRVSTEQEQPCTCDPHTKSKPGEHGWCQVKECKMAGGYL